MNPLDTLLLSPQDAKLILDAHLQKPEKACLYERALRKFAVAGKITFSLGWNWYAFIGGCAFFCIEKYIKSLLSASLRISFFIYTTGTQLAVHIFAALTAKYFYSKKV